jgi:hypothetical protein
MIPLCGIAIGFAVIVAMVCNQKKKNQVPTDQEMNDLVNEWHRKHIERNNP